MDNRGSNSWIRAFIAVGSNLGDRFSHLQEAINRLPSGSLTVRRISRVYENSAIGIEGAGPFLNAVVEIDTHLTAEALLNRCQHIERLLGRVATSVWSSRSIDLDIILYGSGLIRTDRLQVPHALAAERDFVIVPLLDLLSEKRLREKIGPIDDDALAAERLTRIEAELSLPEAGNEMPQSEGDLSNSV